MLLKRIFISACLSLGIFISSFGQVNLQTGSAVFSLPMFNWQDDKSHLTSLVALNYSSGNGLKVNDVASNVGQGWNLVAGGVITRMQMGEPDDQPAYPGHYPQYFDQDLTKYPAGCLYASTPVSQGCPGALGKYPTYGSRNQLYVQHNVTEEDKQRDYFSFQFNGKSGMFIIDTAGGWHGVPIGDTKLKIAIQTDPVNLLNLGIRTTITSFTITDADGLIYKFTRHGLTKLLKKSFSSYDGARIAAEPKIKTNNVYAQSGFDLGPTSAPWYNTEMAYPYVINSWYLSEIDDPFVATRQITFTYDSLNLNNTAGADISYNHSSNDYAIVSYKKSITFVMRIKSVAFPDGHLVIFTYNPNSRIDYPGQNALTSVSITYSGRSLSQYLLNTSYFILNRYGTPSTAYEKSCARLCLRSVQKIGVDLKEDSPPYLFDYFTGSNASDDFVPPPFFYAKDIWGYYNGSNSIASNSPLPGGSVIPVPLDNRIPYNIGFYGLQGLCFRNVNVTGTYYNAKSGFAQNGLLKQIVYPTGGSLNYQYAQNTGSFTETPANVLNVGGVHVSQTSSADGGYSNGCGTPLVTQYNYVVNGTGSASSLWGLETPVNFVATTNNWQEEHKTIHFSLAHPFGECLWHYVYPGIMSQYESVSLDDFQNFMVTIAPILGILSVVSTISDIVNVLGPETGVGEIIAVILDVITAVFTYILGCPQQTKITTTTSYYDFDLNEISPLPSQFKRVEITESPGNSGKTVQQFTHGDPNDPGGPDYPLWFAAGSNATFSGKQRFAPWAYGLPKLTTVYDVNGAKIKETQNVYNFNYAMNIIYSGQPCLSSKCVFPPPISSCKCQVLTNYSERSDNWSNPSLYDVPSSYIATSNSDMGVDPYVIYTGRTLLTTTYERIYRTTDASQYVQTETDYSYNAPGYISINCVANNCKIANYDVNLIVTTQSNGDVNYKSIKYSSDYNTGVLATMVTKNMFSVPVSTATYVIKSGSSTAQYLSEKVTEFVQLANADIKPFRVLEQRFASPVTSFTAYSGPTTTNYSLYKIPQVFNYDGNYNLAGMQDEGGRTVTNIYDYNDKYIVASVINANSATDKCAYTSFESGDLTRSGWGLTGSGGSYSTTSFITGARGFVLNSNTLYTSLNTAKAYILSFWANNTSVVVTGGATLVKSAPTYNGMTYYEYNIALGTSGVSLTGNSIIDELRLYPQTARMKTTTYDPLIGKTSESDENNRIIYYTYDNLGRLQFVKDEAFNIVKMYEYNNVSDAKQVGCPATFTNHLISEFVSRNNCAAGYQGTAVTYTVPANTYSSARSQLDADIQADINMLTNAQSYANTNGSCSLIYYNVAVSETDTSRSCGPGSIGGPVTYTVPANTYSSIVSQADANQQAYDDTAANAQAYINSPFHASCPISTTPDWEWFPGDGTAPADPSYCASVGGALPPHLFVLATDVNPHSPTYNQTQYEDYGPNSACPAGNYYNVAASQAFTRNNCATGYIGSSVTYAVAPGVYSSTVSQAAANLLATNDISANGQAYANAHGTCNPNIVVTGKTSYSYGSSSGGGTITGPSGVTVTCTVSASGSPGFNYSLSISISGATPSGPTSVTNGSVNFTFIMPVSGSVSFTGTYSAPNSTGSGSFSAH